MSEPKEKTWWTDFENTIQKRLSELRSQLYDVELELHPLKRKMGNIFNSNRESILVQFLSIKYIELLNKKTCLEKEIKEAEEIKQLFLLQQ